MRLQPLHCQLLVCGLLAISCGGAPDEPTEAEKGNGKTPTARASIAGVMGATVSGKATFVQNGSDVFLSLSLDGCTPTPAAVAGVTPTDTGYPVSIYQATACDQVQVMGAQWGQGTKIGNAVCSAAAKGWVINTAPNTAWTIGGASETNVVGHTLVVHQSGVADAPPPVACGVIADAAATP